MTIHDNTRTSFDQLDKEGCLRDKLTSAHGTSVRDTILNALRALKAKG